MKNQIKTLCYLLLCCLLLPAVQAQPSARSDYLHRSDSLLLCRAAWQQDTVQGLLLRSVAFTRQEYLGSNQRIFVLEVPPRAGYTFAFSYRPRRTPTSVQAAATGAVAAVNGSYFDMKKHNPICYLRMDGKLISTNLPGQDPVNRKYYQTGTITIDAQGQVAVHPVRAPRQWEDTLAAYPHVMTAGPLLLYHDSILPQRQDRTFVTQRHNRTALGIRRDGTVLLVAVDGRAKEAAGMSIEELTATLYYLGCETAINLDGGGSTTLWLRGRAHNGVVNYPSDNGRFDHRGERPVSNCLLVMPAPKQ